MLPNPRDNKICRESLRVALITGTLGQAGAEKQFMFILQSLLRAGVAVQVYTPAAGGFYADVLRNMKLTPISFGRYHDPLRRTAILIKELRRFEPDIVQSIHAFTNPYASLAAKAVNAVSIGGLRSDLGTFRAQHRLLASLMLKMPDGLAVNSSKALRELTQRKGLNARRVYLLRNCVELPELSAANLTGAASGPTAAFVGRLIPSKRVDLFLHALAIARRSNATLTGLVVGEGPCAEEVKNLAHSLGLLPDHVTFLGNRTDVPSILQNASMMVLCSETEGCPNVLLESMAAGIPAVVTPAGDCPDIVDEGQTGYIVPFNDADALANRMMRLAQSSELRRQMGRAARERVTASYGQLQLSDRLFTIYTDVLERCHRHPPAAFQPIALAENTERLPRSH